VRTSTPAPPTPTSTSNHNPLLDNYLTATPFYGSDLGPDTALLDIPECPAQFRYPSNWEFALDRDLLDESYCMLLFRPTDWLEYIEEAYLELPEYLVEVLHYPEPSFGIGFGFDATEERWFTDADSPELAAPVDLIMAGDNYILRGEYAARGFADETGLSAGLQSYWVYSIGNAEGQALSIMVNSSEGLEGAELILRTIEFDLPSR